ncbi:MAG TPA: hypothetical protein VE422_37750 [Terriglobia bacterium]|nr:hypothetical protein [Terriglobia bacterium]
MNRLVRCHDCRILPHRHPATASGANTKADACSSGGSVLAAIAGELDHWGGSRRCDGRRKQCVDHPSSRHVTEKKACCKPAPVVMEFSPSGKLLQSWSGAGAGYEWPLENDEHGIFVSS